MTRFSHRLALAVSACLCLSVLPATAQQTRPNLQDFAGVEVQKAEEQQNFAPLIPVAEDLARQRNTTSCFADRADILLLAEGLAIYCDGDVADGSGRLLEYGKFVPQLYILENEAKGALSIDRVLDIAQAASLRNMTGDRQLGESRFLVQGIAPNGSTACPGWAAPVTLARGDTQCRTLTMAQSWAMPPIPKQAVELPPATVRFEVQESRSRPPLQCKRAGC
ncbi:hypothetical protein FF098_010075 [Parvularcula flava]|uniref:Uncharacterized protein n=1 Tax=Aquisalinus luteolus TaxID=1566827 RepID=A0A8J3ERK9_9PROT|nr:hypothetical protein [Aquisalinus luteolus]NHK28251.1 hypothetical protein [Aquisalinus luteolus]GGH97919.1 hypothetical protein GCM10011355_20290 [Aquisalinus luteolus]